MRKRVNRLVLLVIIVVGLVSIGCEANSGPINWNQVEKAAIRYTIAEYHELDSAMASSDIHPEIDEWMNQTTPPNGLFKTLKKIPNDLLELEPTLETHVAIINKATFGSKETVYIVIHCNDMTFRLYVLNTGKIYIVKNLWDPIEQTATCELILESKDGAVDFQAYLDLVQVRLSR
ncbi:MAG: hypothetical protein IJR83_04885 [Clostridia bacterium]|nr:hypothetical protein [Clostridia bacterium]